MSSNSFGRTLRMTTFGESHGRGIGAVLDGLPAGLCIDESWIADEMAKRAPGRVGTSPRREKDAVEILSGVFEGKSTGAPIALFIANTDADSRPYEAVKHIYKPGSAQYTYAAKYGHFDYRGGGRASARETAARVACGAIAKLFLKQRDIFVLARVIQVGSIRGDGLTQAMLDAIEAARAAGDSLGALISCTAHGVPIGLGDPVYEKLSARLAFAMMSIPAARGFEIGEGFSAATMKGSEHNDAYTSTATGVIPSTNHAGGILGGISTGQDVVFNVSFKPTASIAKPQASATTNNEAAIFELPKGSRHDPCVGIRAVAVVEAMAALVLADAVLGG